MRKILFILALCLSAQAASAYQMRVLERVYRPSCSYFTSIIGEYAVLLNAPEYEGSKIEMQMGWNGMNGQKKMTWVDRKTIQPSRKLGNSYVFTVKRNLINRGSPYRYNGFSFRFKVISPRGVVILSGSHDPSTFLVVSSKLEQTPCPDNKGKIKRKNAYMYLGNKN